jgi:carbon monoxide dehydrogenase subunit G
MFRHRVSEHINASIDHVWEVFASCERFPEWAPVEVKDCKGRRDRVGARVTTVVRVFGRKLEGIQETTRADRPHTFVLKLSDAGGVKATADFTFTEARGGTDMTEDLVGELPMGMFAGIAEKLLRGTIERTLRHGMENFKELCESTTPAHV